MHSSTSGIFVILAALVNGLNSDKLVNVPIPPNALNTASLGPNSLGWNPQTNSRFKCYPTQGNSSHLIDHAAASISALNSTIAHWSDPNTQPDTMFNVLWVTPSACDPIWWIDEGPTQGGVVVYLCGPKADVTKADIVDSVTAIRDNCAGPAELSVHKEPQHPNLPAYFPQVNSVKNYDYTGASGTIWAKEGQINSGWNKANDPYFVVAGNNTSFI